MKKTAVAIVVASIVFNLFVMGCGKKDAERTVSKPATGQSIQTDSDSVKKRIQDSLMLIGKSRLYEYQKSTMMNAHRNLAEEAHQDPAKTRRLLNKITESAPERLARARKINEARNLRLKALQNHIQGQNQSQPQPEGASGDSGK